ncbi:MAG: hypothetical protein ACOX3W_03350 [Christensenellaceae bacterium]|jgi:Ca2+/H+ antiporter
MKRKTKALSLFTTILVVLLIFPTFAAAESTEANLLQRTGIVESILVLLLILMIIVFFIQRHKTKHTQKKEAEKRKDIPDFSDQMHKK